VCRSRNGTLGRPRGVAAWRWRRGGGTGPSRAGFARRGKAPLRLGLSRRAGGSCGLSGRLSKDRTKGTVCTWPCNIYVSSYVTHVPALGSECVSQDCASGRSGQSLDGSRAEHLSIPIPENAKQCPSQRFVRWGMSRGSVLVALPETVLHPALHSIVVAPHTRRHGGLQAHPCR
jgi:hypothetical protein